MYRSRKTKGSIAEERMPEPKAEIKPSKQKNLKTLWIAIIASFVLMGGSTDHPSGSQSPEHRPHPDPLPVRLRIVDRPVCPDLYRMENAMGREE